MHDQSIFGNIIHKKKEEGRRKKEEGRRKTEEGRRKKEDGRRKREEGRRKKEDGISLLEQKSLVYLLQSML
ncbi:hypothetical protein [Microcoleus sp. D2_18a_D3]|uniref:hypothetical protein n=1 Tax=Microcoleus sp. D2_18a_D3 TaxID=3055330 RepID=UPI002FD6DB05